MRAKRTRSRSSASPRGYEISKKGSAPKKRKTKKFPGIKSLLEKVKILSIKSGMDVPFLFLVLTIIVVGLVMMFSASYPNAYYLHNGDSFYFIKNQLIFAVIGIIGMFAVSYVDYNYFHKCTQYYQWPLDMFTIFTKISKHDLTR